MLSNFRNLRPQSGVNSALLHFEPAFFLRMLPNVPFVGFTPQLIQKSTCVSLSAAKAFETDPKRVIDLSCKRSVGSG